MNKVKDLFRQYPEATELYEDTQGQVWVDKATAQAQCREGKLITHKREKETTKKVK